MNEYRVTSRVQRDQKAVPLLSGKRLWTDEERCTAIVLGSPPGRRANARDTTTAFQYRQIGIRDLREFPAVPDVLE